MQSQPKQIRPELAQPERRRKHGGKPVHSECSEDKKCRVSDAEAAAVHPMTLEALLPLVVPSFYTHAKTFL